MRRLSIIDLTGGTQPMWDERRERAVVFNGAIYNAPELRAQLIDRGHLFASDHSDTEVLVHGYEEWDTGLFERLDGMFALAIWDIRKRRLVAARDRVGEKPLYIAKLPGGFALASELKALLRNPGVGRSVDPVALEQYLSFDFALSPRSIIAGIERLPAGHFALITRERCDVQRYWRMAFRPSQDPEDALVRRFDDVLDRAVSTRLVADVPLGLFLSGGLDSTTIGYYMRRHRDRVRSFTIGFEEPGYDESSYAELAASHLGTEHHTEVFSQDRIWDLVPQVADILDEPMADQSIFPTYLLSRFARGHVKVALGGDGGDELLMGYRTYQALKLAHLLDIMPSRIRELVAKQARQLAPRESLVAERGLRALASLDRSPVERLLSHNGSYHGRARWVIAADHRENLPGSVFTEPVSLLSDGAHGADDAAQLVAAYVGGYLQDDILTKVDRASMAVSLEVRAPFLASELVDFLGTVPASLKLHGMTSKYLLRHLMRGRVPDAVIDRPKSGFGVPLSLWMRDSLAPLVRDYLSPARIAAGGHFDTAAVARIVDEHVKGVRDRGRQVWSLLLFELWRERWQLGVAESPRAASAP
jgi:asparagine synthase (glutamine-hydrolysing)